MGNELSSIQRMTALRTLYNSILMQIQILRDTPMQHVDGHFAALKEVENAIPFIRRQLTYFKTGELEEKK